MPKKPCKLMAAVLLYAEFIAIECATTLCLLGNRSTYHTYHSKYLYIPLPYLGLSLLATTENHRYKSAFMLLCQDFDIIKVLCSLPCTTDLGHTV